MLIEYAQLLSTAHCIVDSNFSGYKPALVNHPSNMWVRESTQNYSWLYQLFYHLSREYSHRYSGKVHATFKKHGDFLSKPPSNCFDIGFTEPPQAMPDIYKVSGNTIEAYRRFYCGEKFKFAKWKNRDIPPWFNFNVWDELQPNIRETNIAFMLNPSNTHKTDINILFVNTYVYKKP